MKKEIKGFSGYYITEEGLVLNGSRPLKAQVSSKGVPFVKLKRDDEYFSITIAKLVLLTFIGEPNAPSDIPSYKDGNNHNYHVSNLEWSSRSKAYSMLYDKTNRYSEKRLEKLRQSICKPVACFERTGNTITLVKTYSSITEAAKDVGVKPASIIRCLKNLNHSCVGYAWQYITKED